MAFSNAKRLEFPLPKPAGGTLRLPAQGISAGALESAYRRELQSLIARKALARLWAKDLALWPAQPYETESLKSNLRWLDLPEQLGPLLTRVVARATQVETEGFEDVVFVTLASSSLAAETVLQLPSAGLGKRTFLLNTVDPDRIRALEANLRLEKTLFIFASKSGKDIDSHSLLLYFLEKLRLLGIPSAYRHFVVLAEEDSYLGQLAIEYQFIDHFLDPPGIHGRYSSLIHFNFYLAAVGHLDPQDLLSRAQSMRDACAPAVSGEANPALSLASCLAAAEIEGLSRLVFLAAPALQAVVRRMGHLVGASTCKGGRGIVPVFGGTSYPLEMLGQGCLVICLKMAGAEQPDLRERCADLRQAFVPLITIELNGPEDFPAELYKWEIATALACSSLGLNPFADSNIGESRAKATQLLEQITDKRQLPARTARVREGGIELYAEGQTRRELSTLNMAEAVRSFFALRRQGSYLALLPFMDLNPHRAAIFREISCRLESRLGIPAIVTPGPRYLRTLGQVYHGGPANGLFLLLSASPEKDIVIPGAKYTFGQLQLALALGDFDSLSGQGRPVIQLHLTNGAEQGLAQVESILGNVLGKPHNISP